MKNAYFIVDRLQHFASILVDIRGNFIDTFNRNGLYLIFCDCTESIEDINFYFNVLWKEYHLTNVFLLIKSKVSHRFEIFTYTVFRYKKCDLSEPINAGIFNEKTRKFDGLDIDLQVFTNLHECPLPLVSIIFPPAIFPNGEEGYEIDLLNELSMDLNFTIKPRVDRQMFIMIGGLTTSLLGTFKVIYPSTCYASFDQVFVIPKSRYYTAFEKILLPFDTDTWTLVLMLFIVSVITIFILKLLTTKKVQNFVFGSKVKTPITNLLIAFVGGTQTKLPTRNFARFLLALFLIYCLVIRTCYQTKLYEMMQSDETAKGLKTIDDLIESDLPVSASKSVRTVYAETFSRYIQGFSRNNSRFTAKYNEKFINFSYLFSESKTLLWIRKMKQTLGVQYPCIEWIL